MHPRHLLFGPTLSSVSLAARYQALNVSTAIPVIYLSSWLLTPTTLFIPLPASNSYPVVTYPVLKAQILDTLADVKLVSHFHPFI